MDVSGAGNAFEYNDHVLRYWLIPDVGPGSGKAQSGGQNWQFPVGCASVFGIVSMTTRAIKVIDFMVDSNLQIIKY